jgi:membrane-bound inhibitor of C-type lysozyme
VDRWSAAAVIGQDPPKEKIPMPHRAKHLTALAPIALLAACGGGSDEASAPASPAATSTAGPITGATTPAAAATPIAYDCLPAQNLTVRYDQSGATPSATLTLDGATYQLASVPGAGGATRYSTDQGRTSGKTLVWQTQGPASGQTSGQASAQDGTLYEGDVGGSAGREQQIAECSPSA